jgi:hypothetical protein
MSTFRVAIEHIDYDALDLVMLCNPGRCAGN